MNRDCPHFPAPRLHVRAPLAIPTGPHSRRGGKWGLSLFIPTSARRENGDSSAGFTLLEVLVATLLLAGVVTSALMFISAGEAVEDSVRRQISRNEQAQLAFEQFDRAFATCLPPGGEYAAGLSATAPEAEAETGTTADAEPPATQMSMVSAAGLGRRSGRLVRFTFRFAVGEEGATGRLVMNVAPVGEDLSDADETREAGSDEQEPDRAPAGAQSAPLVDGLTDVRFKFFDGLEWVADVWDSACRGGLPQLVRVELWFTTPPEAEEEAAPVALPPGAVFARTFRLPAAAPLEAEAAEGGGRVIR